MCVMQAMQNKIFIPPPFFLVYIYTPTILFLNKDIHLGLIHFVYQDVFLFTFLDMSVLCRSVVLRVLAVSMLHLTRSYNATRHYGLLYHYMDRCIHNYIWADIKRLPVYYSKWIKHGIPSYIATLCVVC